MKKILNICAVAAIVLLAASCNRKLEYEHTTFATFNSVTYAVGEDTVQFKIPVTVYNPTNADMQVVFKAVDNSAMKDVDYTISPASGILNFTAEAPTQEIVVDIINFPDTFTGNKSFAIELVSSSDALSIGNFNTAKVQILDLDHPLSAFIGTWAGTLAFASDPPEEMPTELVIEAVEDDETYTKLTVFGLEAAYAQYAKDCVLEAVYDKSRSTIIIPYGQTAFYVNSNYDFVFIGLDESWSSFVNVEFKYDEAKGTLTQMTDYGALDAISGSLYSAYYSGAVFTKK